jgi:hypothetical protein
VESRRFHGDESSSGVEVYADSLCFWQYQDWLQIFLLSMGLASAGVLSLMWLSLEDGLAGQKAWPREFGVWFDCWESATRLTLRVFLFTVDSRLNGSAAGDEGVGNLFFYFFSFPSPPPSAPHQCGASSS